MNTETREFLRAYLSELGEWTLPIIRDGERPRGLYQLFTLMGWNLEGLLDRDNTDVTNAAVQSQSLFAALAGAADAADEQAVANAAHGSFETAINSLQELADTLFADTLDSPEADIAKALAEDTLQLLAVSYLARNYPTVFQIAKLLGVVREEVAPKIFLVDEAHGELLRFPVVRSRISMSELVTALSAVFERVLSGMLTPPPDSPEAFLDRAREVLHHELRLVLAVGEDQLRQGLSVRFDLTGIVVTADNLPYPESTTGPITLSFPFDHSPVIKIEPGRWILQWTPDAIATPASDAVLFESVGLQVTLLAGGDDTCPARGVTLTSDDVGLRARFAGGLRVALPVDAITDTAANQVTAQACAHFDVDLDGSTAFELDHLSVGGSCQIGGAKGLLVEDAQIALENLRLPLDDADAQPFDLSVSGKLVFGNSQIATVASFDGAKFELQSEGEVELGNGIWLLPHDDRPILKLSAQTDTGAEFKVNGLFRIPHAEEADGTRNVAVSGDLKLKRASNGDWSVESFAAALEGTNIDWTLPGGLLLDEFQVALGYAASGGFSAGIGGALELGEGRIEVDVQLIFDDIADPRRMRIDAAVALESLNLHDQVVLLEVSGARMVVDTRVDAGTVTAYGSLSLETATAGLFPLGSYDAAAPRVEDFDLSVADAGGKMAFGPDGFTFTIDSGVLQLPPSFSADPAAAGSPRASVSISDTGPLVLDVHDGSVHFDAEFVFAGFGVSFGDPGAEFRALLASAVLHISNDALPSLVRAGGALHIPLPQGGEAVVAFADVAWDLTTGLPTGSIYLAESLPPWDLNGIELVVLGGDDTDDPETGLKLSRTNGNTELRIDSAIRVVVSGQLLAQDDGTSLFLEAAGALTLYSDGSAPQVDIERLKVGGTFRVGGPEGFKIQDGEVAAEQINNVLAPSQSAPFVLRLSGTLTLPGSDGGQGPSGGLDNARLIFEGDPWPRFDIDGVEGATGDLLAAEGYLPLAFTRLELQFDDSVPMPDKLLPEHVTIIADATVTIQQLLSGGVQGLEIRLDDNGVPQVRVDALHLEVTGLEVVEGFSLGGGIAIGGLDDIPNSLVLAGRLGGKLNGAGVKALVAFGIIDGLPSPLGASLEVSMGPAGIPLGPSGFLLTGASGGVSYTGGNADPDDLRAYVQVDDDGAVTSQPRPAPEDAADTPVDAQVDTQPASGPPAGVVTEFQCPDQPCPPPTVGILYEPHPDSERYRNRIIWKFTSLPKSLLDEILNQVGITPASLQSMTAKRIGEKIADGIVSVFRGAFPFLDDELDKLELELAGVFEGAATAAFSGGDSVYDALVAAAYKGVRAPNEALKLTGTLSYAGVSAFLSITGGFVVSPSAQYAGIVGSLNLVGIPVGKLRGFYALNNAMGNVDPTLCGDLTFAIGPLELGYLRLSARFGFDATEFATMVIELVAEVSETTAANVLEVVDRPLFESKGRDVVATLTEMNTDQVLAFVGLLMQQPMDQTLRTFLVELFDRTWEIFEPELLICGSAQPKLFGLALDAELVGVSAMAKKQPDGSTFMAASFRFSPSAILSRVLYGILPPFDQMKLGYRVGLPDPRFLIESGITGEFIDPQKMAPRLAAGLTHVLREGVATVEYEIAPLGLKLGDAEARLMMPNVVNHPAHPNSTWKRPEDRRGNKPSRLNVALAALNENKLADVFWLGTAAEIKKLSTLPNANRITRETLLEDYYPHGGFLGAGKLMLPRILVDAPPFEEMAQLSRGSLVARATAAMAFVNDFILTTKDVGRIAFYLPAPNPPMAAFQDDLGPLELIEHMTRNPFDLSKVAVAEFYSLGESFLRGSIGVNGQPLTLLGIPVGSASIELVPPSGTQSEGTLRVSAAVPRGSWLRRFVNSASLEFMIRQTPPEPIEKRFGELLAALNSRRNRNAVLADVIADLNNGIPKVSLLVDLDRFQFPSPWSQILKVQAGTSVTLAAYSPFYAPRRAPANEQPMAMAKRLGGAAIKGRFKFGDGFGLDVELRNAEIALLAPVNGFPGLVGDVNGVRIRLPFGIPVIQNGQVSFDFPPESSGPVLPSGGARLKGTVGSTTVDFGLESAPVRLAGTMSHSQRLQNTQLGPVRVPGTTLKLCDSFRISANLSINATVDIRRTSGAATLRGKFRWRNRSWTLPELRLTRTDTTHLGQAILKHLKTHVFDVFESMFTNPTRWLNALKSDWITLNNQTAQNMAQVLKWMGLSLQQVASKLKLLGFSARDINRGLSAAFTVSAQSAANVLKGLGFGADAIGDVLKSAYSQGTDAAAKILRNAGFTASAISSTLKKYFTQNARKATRALKRAGFAANAVAKGIKGVFVSSAKAAADALKYAGFTANAIGTELKNVFSASRNAIAKALKDAGFGVKDVSRGIRAVTSSANNAAKALKHAGYGASNVAKGLKSIFTNNATTASKALKNAGFNAKKVCQGLYDQFSSNMTTVAKALKNAGFGFNTILNAIVDVSDASWAEVTNLLNSIF